MEHKRNLKICSKASHNVNVNLKIMSMGMSVSQIIYCKYGFIKFISIFSNNKIISIIIRVAF